MPRQRLSHRVLGIILAFAWMLGPCHLGALSIITATSLDGGHEIILSESSEDTLITLAHRREDAASDACPPGHHHSLAVAWLLKNDNSEQSHHPDHHIALHQGKTAGIGGDLKRITPATLFKVQAPAMRFPVVVAIIPPPLSEPSENDKTVHRRGYLPPAQQRPAVLLI